MGEFFAQVVNAQNVCLIIHSVHYGRIWMYFNLQESRYPSWNLKQQPPPPNECFYTHPKHFLVFSVRDCNTHCVTHIIYNFIHSLTQLGGEKIIYNLKSFNIQQLQSCRDEGLEYFITEKPSVPVRSFPTPPIPHVNRC